MQSRFVYIWFRHLVTDWFILRQPPLRTIPFVLRTADHGRMMISATNVLAEQKGIHTGMVLADARAVTPDLEAIDDPPEIRKKLLEKLAAWCIRFSPSVAIDLPDGLILDATGCSHLWGGDDAYVDDITDRLSARGYDVRVSMADTLGAAWGAARFGRTLILPPGKHQEALMHLPPEALRLEEEAVARLRKLGLHQVKQVAQMPRASLRRRFGNHLLMRLDQALGQEIETINPVVPIDPYQERLPCMEPITTAVGIELALKHVLDSLCDRLQREQKGVRAAVFSCYRLDGEMSRVSIGTSKPSHHVDHLYHLFSDKLQTIEPGLGIELFTLEAPKVEDHFSQQENMWEGSKGLRNEKMAELLDRLANRAGTKAIHRYLPDEHHWPERSFKQASSLQEAPTTYWTGKPRPLRLLPYPQVIEVTAPIPDYPPMLFRYKGKVHQVIKADGPERIEQEWWMQWGQHRDYYQVEDDEGQRFWLFRLGHYQEKTYQWFLHGFFA